MAREFVLIEVGVVVRIQKKEARVGIDDSSYLKGGEW